MNELKFKISVLEDKVKGMGVALGIVIVTNILLATACLLLALKIKGTI